MTKQYKKRREKTNIKNIHIWYRNIEPWQTLNDFQMTLVVSEVVFPDKMFRKALNLFEGQKIGGAAVQGSCQTWLGIPGSGFPSPLDNPLEMTGEINTGEKMLGKFEMGLKSGQRREKIIGARKKIWVVGRAHGGVFLLPARSAEKKMAKKSKIVRWH